MLNSSAIWVHIHSDILLRKSKASSLPNLQQLGLGNIADIQHIPAAVAPEGYYGKMAEVSVGKDTMTGHWELMGLRITTPFKVFPDGFPRSVDFAI